jgi:hypothetical protein
MLIHYHEGRTAQAILLSRTANSVRVAVQGAEDIAEFRQVNGTWVSEDCEPVTIEFALAQISDKPAVTLADCICPADLAAGLVKMLCEAERVTGLEAAATIASALMSSSAGSIWAV